MDIALQDNNIIQFNILLAEYVKVQNEISLISDSYVHLWNDNRKHIGIRRLQHDLNIVDITSLVYALPFGNGYYFYPDQIDIAFVQKVSGKHIGIYMNKYPYVFLNDNIIQKLDLDKHVIHTIYFHNAYIGYSLSRMDISEVLLIYKGKDLIDEDIPYRNKMDISLTILEYLKMYCKKYDIEVIQMIPTLSQS